MTIRADLQVHFTSTERGSRYYYEASEIQYGANDIGAFMIITYYEYAEVRTALHYLDELYIVSNLNGQETYYRNFNI